MTIAAVVKVQRKETATNVVRRAQEGTGRVLATIAVATRPAPLDRVADMIGDVDREVTRRNREALAIPVRDWRSEETVYE
ncbi:hypothetical protein Pmar_PMAR025525 [Perkinsus marinus ATCC 50983]|uniref:Uncharacterized protein n=1 Tax=Perkinsus marinus (strain ATCC 50983 / TXsc) TaxID=423536 RepID=C5LZA7_PERM5|nr:hypothetical protein Pmar_PMAR025525 [Perkinsus marinus ATCC 50983]EEQ97901.1 hypothetical protein Pmar_PMAR025525 [Perkinsus marinus ATCC 50983]|eukprot:XP_002765184.1 hypothetical protein Pmar_PMAR025525 [Perkinsus marinus ATCC 50983]